MPKEDVYGFGDRLALEAFDTTTIDMMAAEGRSSIEDLVSAANSMEALSESIQANGVSRQDAVTLESIAPTILPVHIPVNSFTLYPTATNLKVALEAIDSWKNLNIMNLLKAVYKFLTDVVTWIINQFKKLFGKNQTEGPRVLENTRQTVTAASNIMTQTSTKVDANTVKDFDKALEKAKLTVSDKFNHLTRRLVNEPGTVSVLNNLRNQLHTAYAKLDTVSEKFAKAIEACGNESRYDEAVAMLNDLGALNPDTLVDTTELAILLDVTKQVPKLTGAKQITALRDLCQKLVGKHSSWDVKNSDTVQALTGLTERLDQLVEAIVDPLLGDSVPEVHDFTSKAKGAPDKIAQPLMDASRKLGDSFVVAQDCLAIFSILHTQILSLVEGAWDASKILMGSVATAAKRNKEVKELVESIETSLKATLKKAS